MITTVLGSRPILSVKKIQLRNEQDLTHCSKHDHNAQLTELSTKIVLKLFAIRARSIARAIASCFGSVAVASCFGSAKQASTYLTVYRVEKPARAHVWLALARHQDGLGVPDEKPGVDQPAEDSLLNTSEMRRVKSVAGN